MEQVISSPAAYETYRSKLQQDTSEQKRVIAICGGTGCLASGAQRLFDAFKEEITTRNLNLDVELRKTGCHGFCEQGPLVVIHPEKTFYHSVTEDDVDEILNETVAKGAVIDRLLFKEPGNGTQYVMEDDVPFYKHQKRLLLGHNVHMDPESIDDYIRVSGYSSLVKALTTMQPDAIIEEVKKANLRGRGGGGFPAGRKWESCRKAPGEPKYVICNADEGDPGAYMDRSLLEGNPHSVIEGMIIGAYAIGSNIGYVYVRKEYPLACANLEIALKTAREYGFLGKNILGTGFDFDIKVSRGGGAFVCGESTALMASIEGMPGEPRAKHIHTVVSGLYNKPTNLNNVETWANVPLIIDKGADWYSQIGTEGSKGTKIFSLVGKVNNTGLVEVPMGISLRKIIFDIGGGIKNGKKFKAVQTGGPSGGCLPAELLDLQVDFDKLTEVGSMMGSGGMIVMDEDNCMVDVAKYFLNFLQDESCGKCTTCRYGLRQVYHIVDKISQGKAVEEDLTLLEELCKTIAEGSLCALGQTAPNPVLSTIRYFRDEYQKHIVDKVCPAKVCKGLIKYEINDKCTGCLVCLKQCPVQAITGEKKKLHVIDTEKCTRCGICMDVCKFDAVNVH